MYGGGAALIRAASLQMHPPAATARLQVHLHRGELQGL